MAVLHITYLPNPDNADAAYDGFSQILKSYRSIRLSQSNWAIHTAEPPKDVWQKLKRYTEPNEYLVMFPLVRVSGPPTIKRLFNGYWLVHRFVNLCSNTKDT